MIKKATISTLLIVLFGAGLLAANPMLRAICSELVAANEGKSAVAGADGWMFLSEELVHVSLGRFWGDDAAKVSRTKKKEYADPLAEIVTYNKALEDKGITLYLMPVPPKALVYPDKLKAGVIPGGVEEERALYTEFYRLLGENGVKTIDLLPLLVKKSETEDVYCKTDTHFSGKGLALFASEAAKVIKAQPWYAAVPKETYSTKEQIVTIKGDLSQMLKVEAPEEVSLSLVSVKESGEQVLSDEKSPVILMGDSHTLVFSAGGDLHAKGAGLFDHLSAELGFPLDLLGVRGSGVTPARINLFQRSKKDPGYLAGKKVLIWCFTAREFTGTGGWRSIPVAGKK
ncbi:hypothetical protein [Desulforhopalus sp. IMCC35007]|uniref:alginate O-acetyltransferase AlgX-related protein n=1 Tax=Desulforhopalus sp. IMCC35007 TaxID=2569543 RepID=UPI0010ADBB9F|nr:hypothetical protein [Desulforhopalus sp. IMCC35007]TKB12408.1 hypothetical protein FCL48_01800 [Desulforhopalus sp. IMCC35007]